MKKQIVFGGIKAMWCMVIFDVPVDDKDARDAYVELRKQLKKCGFFRMQYSVYYRHSPSSEYLSKIVKQVEEKLPPDGHIRIFTFTDIQFQRQIALYGKRRGPSSKPPDKPDTEPPPQISFF